MVAMFRLVPTDLGVHTPPPECVVASLMPKACMRSAPKTHHTDKTRGQVPHRYRFKGPGVHTTRHQRPQLVEDVRQHVVGGGGEVAEAQETATPLPSPPSCPPAHTEQWGSPLAPPQLARRTTRPPPACEPIFTPRHPRPCRAITPPPPPRPRMRRCRCPNAGGPPPPPRSSPPLPAADAAKSLLPRHGKRGGSGYAGRQAGEGGGGRRERPRRGAATPPPNPPPARLRPSTSRGAGEVVRCTARAWGYAGSCAWPGGVRGAPANAREGAASTPTAQPLALGGGQRAPLFAPHGQVRRAPTIQTPAPNGPLPVHVPAAPRPREPNLGCRR